MSSRVTGFKLAVSHRCPACDGALEGQSGSGDRSLGGDRGGHSQRVGPSRYEGDGLCERRRKNTGLN